MPARKSAAKPKKASRKAATKRAPARKPVPKSRKTSKPAAKVKKTTVKTKGKMTTRKTKAGTAATRKPTAARPAAGKKVTRAKTAAATKRVALATKAKTKTKTKGAPAARTKSPPQGKVKAAAKAKPTASEQAVPPKAAKTAARSKTRKAAEAGMTVAAPRSPRPARLIAVHAERRPEMFSSADDDDGGEGEPGFNILLGPRNVRPYIERTGEQYMSSEQVEHFRSILTSWKRDLMMEVDRTMTHMKDEAANPPDPNDRATLESEFALELRTRDRERKLIRKIDEALARIDDGSYGYCLETGEPIGIKRLEARPVATLCIEAQERRERREKQYGDRDDWYR